MSNFLIKGGKDLLAKRGKSIAQFFIPDVLNFGAKLGTEFIDNQKSLIKIPDLKDVPIDIVLRVLKDDLNLIPVPAAANPNLSYMDEIENKVVSCEPRFGTRVKPGAPVKVYYLTQDVIDKSKLLKGNQAHSQSQEITMPRVIGLNVFEAREDLEGLGLKVTEKLEKPHVRFLGAEEDQVTRVTYPNNKRIVSKLRTGERIWLYDCWTVGSTS